MEDKEKEKKVSKIIQQCSDLIKQKINENPNEYFNNIKDWNPEIVEVDISKIDFDDTVFFEIKNHKAICKIKRDWHDSKKFHFANIEFSVSFDKDLNIIPTTLTIPKSDPTIYTEIL